MKNIKNNGGYFVLEQLLLKSLWVIQRSLKPLGKEFGFRDIRDASEQRKE